MGRAMECMSVVMWGRKKSLANRSLCQYKVVIGGENDGEGMRA